MADINVLKPTARGHSARVPESDAAILSGIVRGTSGAATLWNDANTTTIALGGGASQSTITIGKASVGNSILGFANLGAATAAVANGDLAFGDAARSGFFDASAGRLLLTGGSAGSAGANLVIGTDSQATDINTTTVLGSFTTGDGTNGYLHWRGADALLVAQEKTASTNAAGDVATFWRSSTGTPAAGFGTSISLAADTSSPATQLAAIQGVWTTAGATPTADFNLRVNQAGTVTTSLTCRGSDLEVLSVAGLTTGTTLVVGSTAKVTTDLAIGSPAVTGQVGNFTAGDGTHTAFFDASTGRLLLSGGTTDAAGINLVVGSATLADHNPAITGSFMVSDGDAGYMAWRGGEGFLSTRQDTAATSTIGDLAAFWHKTSGTPVAGFGSALLWCADDSANALSEQGRVETAWSNAGATTADMRFDVAQSGAAGFNALTLRGSDLATLTAGDLGVRTTDPKAPLHVVHSGTAGTPTMSIQSGIFQNSGTAATNCLLTVISGNTGICGIEFGDTDTEVKAAVRYSHATETMSFFSNGASTWDINSGNDFVPNANNARDIGTTSLRVANIYLAGAISIGIEGTLHNIQGVAATTAATAGSGIQIIPGTGSTTGAGGAFNYIGGVGGAAVASTSVGGDGGAGSLVAGTGGAGAAGAQAAGDGGAMDIDAGAAGATNGGVAGTAGVLTLGVNNASAITIGSSGMTTTIAGNLSITGATTTVSTTNLAVEDDLIIVNSDAATGDEAGIAFERGSTGDDALLLWNEADDRFEFGLFDTSGGTSAPTATLTTFADLKVNTLLLDSTAITADGALTVTATSANLDLTATGANEIQFNTNSAQRWAIDSAGDLIGGAEAATTSILGTDATTAATAGASLSIITGAGNTSGASGELILASGVPGTTGISGGVTIESVAGGSSSGVSGALTLRTGATTAGASGAVAISTGNSGNGAPGSISLLCGTGFSTSSITLRNQFAASTIGIADNAVAQVVTIGNNTATTAVNIETGSAGFDIDADGASSWVFEGALNGTHDAETVVGNTGHLFSWIGGTGGIGNGVGFPGGPGGATSVTGGIGGAGVAGASSTGGGAGGAWAGTGGVGGAGSSGAGSAGAGGTGGASATIGGVGGAGATGGGTDGNGGTGGTASVVGGAGGAGAGTSDNGNGGPVLVTGGAGGASGSGAGGDGGPITITTGVGGTSGGDSGDLAMDVGSVTSGTTGTITLGTTNASGITIGGTSFDTVINGGATVTGANGETSAIKHASVEVTGMSGATVTASSLIPADAIVMGVTVRVTTTITGATTFTIGDGTDADAWGAGIALTSGTTTAPGDFVAAVPVIYSAANDVVLTATGSNFSAGAVRITVHYMLLGAPTS